MGTVYLLHFEKPISEKHTTQHYIGYAEQFEARMEYHRKGRSKVRLLEVAYERGIKFQVVRTWEGDRVFEKRLKSWKNAPRLCPVCRGETVEL